MMHSLNEEHFILRFTPRRTGSIWSRANRKRAEALIADQRMKESGMEKIQEAKENGRWQSAYSSNEEMEIPKDLLEALEANPEVYSHFISWSNSQRLQAVWWLQESKRRKTRESRIAKIVEAARKNQKLV